MTAGRIEQLELLTDRFTGLRRLAVADFLTRCLGLVTTLGAQRLLMQPVLVVLDPHRIDVHVGGTAVAARLSVVGLTDGFGGNPLDDIGIIRLAPADHADLALTAPHGSVSLGPELVVPAEPVRFA